MNRRACVIGLVTLAAAAQALAGQIENGVLVVNGKPFYPLGSWNFEYTTPRDIAQLGMNLSFRGGPSTAEAVEEFRALMRECNALGIQVVPYLSYGGAGVEPWPPEAVRTIAKLAGEPNLLAWYVGDDIGPKHLPGIRQTVTILREETPTIPTVADYIEEETPEAKTTFTQYIDIRCQYTYPIPEDSYQWYLDFFDRQREFVGDPLWTWVQCFMWGRHGRTLNLGSEGPGPLPDPEQVRLLAFTAINRGVRGLLFFAHHSLHRLPELAAEVALVCHEVRVVNDYLAAGAPVFNLVTNNPDVNATAFHYGGSTLLSVAIFKPEYHRWVDEAIAANVTIECPWTSQEPPKALLIQTPDVIECPVELVRNAGVARITAPALELAGFVLVSNDAAELARVREEVAEIPRALRTLMLPAAALQTRKVANVLWQLGIENLYSPSRVMDAMRAVERCSAALDAGEHAQAMRAWREALRASRTVVDDTMAFAEARRELLAPHQQRYLVSPYGLHNVQGLADAPASDDPWRLIKHYLVTGPFPLEWDEKVSPTPAPGFTRSYPPETSADPNAVFESLDGSACWRPAETNIAGLLDLLPYFTTTENAVCYARCRIAAPHALDTALSLGSNDGARLWVNGDLVFSLSGTTTGGRTARPDQDRIPIHLKEGPNTILVKVENLGRDWQLYLRVHDPDRILQLTAE